MSDRNFDIICLSHLKWERTLFQRPQQIMKQLSKSHKVIYVASCGTKEFVKSVLKGKIKDYVGRYNENLFYLNLPYLPFTKHIKLFQKLMYNISSFIAKYLSKRFKYKSTYLWLYYPVYIDYLNRFQYKKLIYDCMDLFRGFKTSLENVQDQENRLLKKADIVFTGGKSLQKSKEGINPKTYCFPSGVEYGHFYKATLSETTIPDDIKDIKHPILGYFGAVDERIDYNLINYICEKRPDWSVVFIGPLVFYEFVPVDQSNFHYLGRKNYDELPNYLKAFDVCLMPFVISELTLHISPTKTPEYLAGGKPVVSTAIPDVIEDYSDVVKITNDYDEFIEKCEQALVDKNEDLSEKIRSKAEAKSWEYIAIQMKKLIDEV